MYKEKWREWIDRGEYTRAIKHLKKDLERKEDQVVRNNLALAYFLSDQYEECVKILAINFKSADKWNPYAHSLASMAFSNMDKHEKARYHLEKAVREFEDGTRVMKQAGHVQDNWREYTVTILRAAGICADHRLVYELFRRWQPLHIHWESTYLAGVAAFNLKRYRQAAKCWASIAKHSNWFLAMQRIALMTELGKIPYFVMDYRIIDMDKTMKKFEGAINTSEICQMLVDDSMVRMFYLANIYDENAPVDSRKLFLQNLTKYGGEWGKQLGENILMDTGADDEMKLAAGIGMVEAGYYSCNEPIPAVIDGHETRIVIQGISMDGSSQGRYEAAHKLFEQGKTQQAAEIIEDDLKTGVMFSPSLLLLARAYYILDQKSKMKEIMPIIVKLCEAEQNNLLYLDLVHLLVCTEEYTQAAYYLDRIRREELPEKLQQILDNMVNQLLLASNFPLFNYEESEREYIEDKTLPLKPTLLRGFRNMPVNWINAACSIFHIHPARMRNEREKQIKEFLQQEENVDSLLRDLTPEALKLLGYIVGKGGWSRVSTINRKFNSMQGDGFCWEEYLPQSPLGQLWCRGLVFVGRCSINQRNTKIAAIPVELLPLFEKLVPPANPE